MKKFWIIGLLAFTCSVGAGPESCEFPVVEQSSHAGNRADAGAESEDP